MLQRCLYEKEDGDPSHVAIPRQYERFTANVMESAVRKDEWHHIHGVTFKREAFRSFMSVSSG